MFECLSQWLTFSKHCFNLAFQSISPVWQEDSEKEKGGREENRGTEMTDRPRLHSAVPALINHTCLSDTAPSYTLMISTGLFIHSTPSPMIPLFKGFSALKAPMQAGSVVYFSIFMCWVYRKYFHEPQALDTLLVKRVFVRLMYCSSFCKCNKKEPTHLRR